MSIEYCERCHKYIDTDYDTDHFIYNEKKDEIVDCYPAVEARTDVANETKKAV